MWRCGVPRQALPLLKVPQPLPALVCFSLSLFISCTNYLLILDFFLIYVYNNLRRNGIHSYCSNYYSEYAEPIEICDWCQCEERNPSSSSRYNKHANEASKIKQQRSDHNKPTGKNPSPRPSARRYKLLKDVMC